jgi:AMP-polyphosphate phosphotransferase
VKVAPHKCDVVAYVSVRPGDAPVNGKTLSIAELDMGASLDQRVAETEIAELQRRLAHIAAASLRARTRSVVLVEGPDAAGKGGLIRRMTAELDPRGVKVWPIGAPTAQERSQHYLQRFWARLPDCGVIAVFDRSWYGRVLVERIEGFATEDEWRRAYDEISAFEHMLVEDGVRLVKLYLHVSPYEQRRRLLKRLGDPWKRWKLSSEDFRNRARAEDYITAADEMFARTSTKRAPWTLIAADDKDHARVAGLRVIADALGRGLDLSPPTLPAEIETAARASFGDAAVDAMLSKNPQAED